MTIILDFDRTIFDTEGFIEYFLNKAPKLRMHPTKEELYVAATEAVTTGQLSFKKGELDRFLFPDTVPFLAGRRKEDTILMTWGGEALQRAKVESLDIEKYFLRVIYTPNLKGIAMKRLLPLPQPVVFVDDDGMQLDSVAAEVPEVTCVWMRRVEVRVAPTALCMEVRSMEELDALIRNLS